MDFFFINLIKANKTTVILISIVRSMFKLLAVTVLIAGFGVTLGQEGQVVILSENNPCNNVCYCNYFDTPPTKHDNCTRIRLTGITLDMDGYLSFEGFNRNDTNGL